MRTKGPGWPAAVILCAILAVPVLSHDVQLATPALSGWPTSVVGVGGAIVHRSSAPKSAPVSVLPTLPLEPEPTRHPIPNSVAIPERTPEPPSHGASSVTGIASWFCGGGSACTRGYAAGGLYAAAGPSLRARFHWRGSSVLVRSAGRMVRVELIDWCACPGRVIDLYRSAFSQLADPSRGVLKVTVTW